MSTDDPKPRQKKRRTRTDHRGVKLRKRTWASGTVSWFARWTDPDTGKERDTGLTGLGLTTAEQRRQWAIRKSRMLARRRAEIELGIAPVPEPEELVPLVADYLLRCEGRGLATGTVANYTHALEAFKRWAAAEGVRTTHDVTAARIATFAEWVKRLRKNSVAEGGRRGEHKTTSTLRSPRSINDILARVGTFLTDARRQGKLPFLDGDGVNESLQRVRGHKPHPEFLRPAELKVLLEAVARHDRATFALTRAEKGQKGPAERGTPRHRPVGPFLLFVLLAGCRAKEVRCLRWTDVYLDSSEIILKPEATKTRHGRSIDLAVSPSLIQLLTSMRLRSAGAPYVFGGAKPVTKTVVKSQRIRLTSKYAAPEFTWQQLRATCATYLVNAPAIYGGASAFLESKRLGHSVVVAEQRYVGLLRDIDRDARTLEAAMGIEKQVATLLAGTDAYSSEVRRATA